MRIEKINPDGIFRMGQIPTLHITFTCAGRDEDDLTVAAFDHIKQYATSSANGWYDVHDLLRMRYNKDKQLIEFEEKPVQNSTEPPITLLPSLLMRDWQLIKQDEFARLNTFIQTHPLVEDALQQAEKSALKNNF